MKIDDISTSLMLSGSDMPIFGDADHPSVSLRLHSAKKPINILTGLDYWLDNLMCQVPDVLMCYHLDGLVQKYEILKTEDLPNLIFSSFFFSKFPNANKNSSCLCCRAFFKQGFIYRAYTGFLYRLIQGFI